MSGEATVTIVTGARDAGKTQWMGELAARRPVWGFISPKVYTDEVFVGYDLLCLPGGDRIPLARRAAAASPLGWFRYRRFHFNETAFDRAGEKTRRVLSEDRLSPGTVFLLDEVGPLEVAGGGLLRELDGFLASGHPLVVTTRPSLVDWLAERTGAGRGRGHRVEVVELEP